MQSVALGMGVVVGVIAVLTVVSVLFQHCYVKMHDLYYDSIHAKLRAERKKKISDNKMLLQ